MRENSVTPVPASATRKAALWISAVFILGLALGGAVGYLVAHRTVSADAAPLSDDARRHQKVAVLTKELDLTTGQQNQIDAIFLDSQVQFQAIHKQSDPLMEEVRQKTRNRVRGVLTAEQQPKFEEFLRKLDEERKLHPQPSH